MGFTRIETLSLTDLFVQQIENMILSGELTVGEQLPPAQIGRASCRERV